MEKIKNADKSDAQTIFDMARETFVEAWLQIIRKIPCTKTPHWNFNLQSLWREMRKARSRATRLDLKVDWMIYDNRRALFEKENRRSKWKLQRRTEELLEKRQGNRLADAVGMDKKWSEEREKESTYNNKGIDPAEVTKFTGTFHDQEQTVVGMKEFTVEEKWLEDIEQGVRKLKHNEAPGVDGIHNEMLKLEPKVSAKVAMELWRLI